MTKNRFLNIVIIACKCIRLIYILLFVMMTTIFIHFQIDKNPYKNIQLNFSPSSSFHISKIGKWKVIDAGEDKQVFVLDKIKRGSLYVNYLKYTIILVLLFFSFREFQKIILSVKHLQIFSKDNVILFRRIGKYVFTVFLLTSYTIIRFQEGGISRLYISFTPLVLFSLAFIMAEIFKEGTLLKQENELTI
jgi:hypothetical protein